MLLSSNDKIMISKGCWCLSPDLLVVRKGRGIELEVREMFVEDDSRSTSSRATDRSLRIPEAASNITRVIVSWPLLLVLLITVTQLDRVLSRANIGGGR